MIEPGLCVSLLHKSRLSMFRIRKLKKQFKITVHQTLNPYQMQEGQTQITWPISGFLCALMTMVPAEDFPVSATGLN